MIYEITENGEAYTYHTDRAEAEKYLADLRRVYPQESWDMECRETGRLVGQTGVHWGGECVVDLLDLSVHQFAKRYMWPAEYREQSFPELHQEIYRYWPMVFEVTEESKAVLVIREKLRAMQFKALPGDRVVRYV